MLDPNADVYQLIQEAARALFAEGMSSTARLAVLLILAVSMARRFLAPRVPFFATDHGAVLLTLATGLLGGLGNALVAGSAMSWGVVAAAFGLSLKAAGGYTALKKAALPLLAKAAEHGPLWWRWVARLLHGVLAGAVAADNRAKAAGDAAVAAKPATGVEGIVGKPRDVR
jgi:hypothetical protein